MGLFQKALAVALAISVLQVTAAVLQIATVLKGTRK